MYTRFKFSGRNVAQYSGDHLHTRIVNTDLYSKFSVIPLHFMYICLDIELKSVKGSIFHIWGILSLIIYTKLCLFVICCQFDFLFTPKSWYLKWICFCPFTGQGKYEEAIQTGFLALDEDMLQGKVNTRAVTKQSKIPDAFKFLFSLVNSF